jgi:hypothetical protein
MSLVVTTIFLRSTGVFRAKKEINKMFKKILIANRGVRAPGAGVRSYAQHVSDTPDCLQDGAAGRAGDRAAGAAHV